MSKSEKLHISVTFLLITIFCAFFKPFSTDSKSAFFDTHTEFLKEIFFLIANAQETAQKNRQIVFMNVSLNLTMQSSKGLQNKVVKIVVP
jgi:hypothetical protein